jgi:hypothetical protein
MYIPKKKRVAQLSPALPDISTVRKRKSRHDCLLKKSLKNFLEPLHIFACWNAPTISTHRLASLLSTDSNRTSFAVSITAVSTWQRSVREFSAAGDDRESRIEKFFRERSEDVEWRNEISALLVAWWRYFVKTANKYHHPDDEDGWGLNFFFFFFGSPASVGKRGLPSHQPTARTRFDDEPPVDIRLFPPSIPFQKRTKTPLSKLVGAPFHAPAF